MSSLKYVIFDSVFGPAVLGGSEQGIRFLEIAADITALERFLQEEYPLATVAEETHILHQWAHALQEYFCCRQPLPVLALDVAGTAFQNQVWEALRAIPVGETLSYGEIAAQIGNPRAYRAVGSACGANPVMYLIPCHRARRQSGALGGFRGGLALKSALLDWEAKITRRLEIE